MSDYETLETLETKIVKDVDIEYMYRHYDDSKLISAEMKDYNINNSLYTIEFGVYVDLESDNFKYALIEEAFEDHKEVRKTLTLTKTKDKLYNVLEERKTHLKSKCKS